MISRATRGGSRLGLAATVVIAAAAVLPACMEDRCGPGQKQEGAACVSVDAENADAGASSDAEAADADTDVLAAETDSQQPAALPAGMGEDCSGEADCEDKEADYCSKKPMDAKGYCTTTGCTMGGSDCPEGYGCFDLSGFGTDLRICRKEG